MKNLIRDKEGVLLETRFSHFLLSFDIAYECMCINLFYFLLRGSLTRNIVTIFSQKNKRTN